MRAPHFPVFLDLEGKRVLVVGGGAVAERKARALARCGARVRVVAPEMRRGLERIAGEIRERAFVETDLKGMWLVVVATDDEHLNRRVAAACRRRRVMHNVADRPRLCAFIMPSVARRGRISIAVSTGGASPALARVLRVRFEKALTSRDAQLAARLARLRPQLLTLPLPRRRKAVAAVLEPACQA